MIKHDGCSRKQQSGEMYVEVTEIADHDSVGSVAPYCLVWASAVTVIARFVTVNVPFTKVIA